MCFLYITSFEDHSWLSTTHSYDRNEIDVYDNDSGNDTENKIPNSDNNNNSNNKANSGDNRVLQ